MFSESFLKLHYISISAGTFDTKKIALQVIDKTSSEIVTICASNSTSAIAGQSVVIYKDPTLEIRVPDNITPVKYFAKALLLPIDGQKTTSALEQISLLIHPADSSTNNHFKLTFRDQNKQFPDFQWNVPFVFSLAKPDASLSEIVECGLGEQTWSSAINELANHINISPSQIILRHHYEAAVNENDHYYKIVINKPGRILLPYEPINFVFSQMFQKDEFSYNHSFSFSIIADDLHSKPNLDFLNNLQPQMRSRLLSLQDAIYSQYLKGDFITFLPNLISRLCSEFSTCPHDTSLTNHIKNTLSSTLISIFMPIVASVTKKWDYNLKTWEAFSSWVTSPSNKQLLTFPIELDTVKAPTIEGSKPNVNAQDTISKLIALAIASRADFIDLVVDICQNFEQQFSGNQPFAPSLNILGSVLCCGQVSIENEKLLLILTRGFVYLCTSGNQNKTFQMMPGAFKLPPKCSIVLALPLSQWNFLPIFHSGIGTFSGPKLIKIQFATDKPDHDIIAFWILFTLVKLQVDKPAIDVPIPNGAVINLSYPYESDIFTISATVSILSHSWVSQATLKQVVDVLESYRSTYLAKKDSNQEPFIFPSVRSMAIPNLYTGETQLNICNQSVEADKLKAAINFTTPMTFLSSEDNKRPIVDQILLRHMVHCAIHDILYSYNIDLIFDLLLLFKLSDMTQALDLFSENLLTLQIESFRIQLEKYRINNIPLLHFVSLSSNEPQFIRTIAKSLYNGRFCVDDDGQNPLFYSLKNPNIAITQVLLESKVDINQCNQYGVSPLILCLICQDYSRAEFLLKNGAYVNRSMLTNVRYESALFYAIRGKMKEASQLLLSYANDEINNPGFNGAFLTHNCITNDFTKIIPSIHLTCPDFNPNLCSVAFDQKENPFPHPLHYLLSLSQKLGEETTLRMLKDLLCSPTLDLNVLSDDDTPLLKSISRKSYKFAEALIHDDRCDVNLLNTKGDTPLLLAISQGSVSTVLALIKANALVDMPNMSGKTPLYAAVEKNDKQIVQLLLESGALPNQWYFDGSLPIHIAKPDIAELLVKYGAKKTLPTFRKSE